MGEADRYFKVTCILDDSASNLKPGMGVAGASGRSVGATIAFRIESTRPVTNLSVTANAYAHNDLGGSASILASADGKNWGEPVVSDPKAKNHVLRVLRPGTVYMVKNWFDEKPLWVRVRLEARAGKKTNTAARLSSLEIKAAVEPRLN